MVKRINSKQKGKRGELELAHYLTDRGFPARRGQQYEGGSDSPDVIIDNLPQYNIEVKRVDKGVKIYDWMDQAVRDSKGKKIPVVVHRKSHQPWVCILLIDDFLNLVRPKDG